MNYISEREISFLDWVVDNMDDISRDAQNEGIEDSEFEQYLLDKYEIHIYLKGIE